MFLYPMWDHESHRIGKQKCTPCGYALHGIAELLGFAGLLLLLYGGFYLGYRGWNGTFEAALLWLLVAPFGIGLVSRALYRFSWTLAVKRGFKYDYDKSEASWLENGKRVTYSDSSEQEEQKFS